MQNVQNFSQNIGLAHYVTRQVALTPDSLAIVTDKSALTYQELNQYANQIAHNLQSMGIGAGALVGVCIERSPDMVASFLAILKVGGAYVPLDPSYPAERLAFMTTDAQLAVILTRTALLSRLPTDCVPCISLDADARQIAQQSVEDPPLDFQPNSLAYVIYTSGTTGQPKGVMVSQRNVQNLIRWHQEAFEITAADRATQLAGMAFDATGWEIWPYLTLGASVHLPDEVVRVSPVALRDWLVTQQITVSFVPTALAEPLLALAWPEKTPLRYLLTGAEALTCYPPAGLPFKLINNYGPTEATVVATSGIIPPKENSALLPPIGKAITNVQIYLLDDLLQLVLPGETGEIYIGGAGVGLGYLNQPEMTAERFIPDHVGGDPGRRLYKTGDRAYFLSDGQLQFVGRADSQIKIRGYRIEPDEVAAVLNRYVDIQASVVADFAHNGGKKELIAYLVPAEGAQIDISGLRRQLQDSLPAYMIPSLFVALTALPLTANGKVDHTALPAPDPTNILWERSITPPTTETEKVLTQIVASILGLPEVGIEENFFFLGGHSFLGTQLIARITAVFGVELPLRTIFDAPTVQQLAETVEANLFAKIAAMTDEEARQLLDSSTIHS